MKNYLVEKIYADREETGLCRSILLNAGKVLGILAATVLLTEALYRAGVNQQSILMIYMLAVIVVSMVTPSFVYGIVAALVYAFVFDFLITVPRFEFSITVGFPFTLLSMLAVTFVISALVAQVKKQQELAVKREKRAELLYELNRALLGANTQEEVVSVAQRYIEKQLEISSVFYTGDPHQEGTGFIRAVHPQDTALLTGAEERRRAHRFFVKGAEEDFLDDASGAPIHYEAAVSRGKVMGVLGVDCRGKPLSPGSRTFLHILTAQMAVALSLRRLREEQSDLQMETQMEKMRSTLLRSISHDLRTPLTGILGAASAILEQPEMPRDTHDALAQDIKTNAQWLIRMVENILTVTRISQETLTVHKSVEAAEEVVSQAVAIVRGRFPDCHIHVRIPDTLLEVPMDATLISQVLINLLENAVKNSQEGALVLLTLKKKDRFALFEVSDHGKGIPEPLLENLFEIHTQYEEQVLDASRGIGIGLSICRTIVNAHGGSIQGHNREEGGARFSFTLPLEEETPEPEEESEAHEQ